MRDITEGAAGTDPDAGLRAAALRILAILAPAVFLTAAIVAGVGKLRKRRGHHARAATEA